MGVATVGAHLCTSLFSFPLTVCRSLFGARLHVKCKITRVSLIVTYSASKDLNIIRLVFKFHSFTASRRFHLLPNFRPCESWSSAAAAGNTPSSGNSPSQTQSRESSSYREMGDRTRKKKLSTSLSTSQIFLPSSSSQR